MLRSGCRDLEYIAWAAPSQCLDLHLGVVGPFATRVVAWKYEVVVLEDEDDDEELGENVGGEAQTVGVWGLCGRREYEVDLTFSSQE